MPVGFSSGVKGLRGKGMGMYDRARGGLQRRAGNMSADMGIRGGQSTGAKRHLYNRGAQTASWVSRNPGKSMGIGAGVGGLMAARSRRNRNQYPMY